MNHSAHGGGIFALDDLVQTAQPETSNRLPHVISAANEADHPLHANSAGGLVVISFFLDGHQLASLTAAFCSFGWRPLISSTDFESVSATCAASFMLSNAVKIALTTLWGL